MKEAIKLRRKKLKSGADSLYLDIYVNGVRTYEFLKLYLTGDKMMDKQTLQLAQSVKAQRLLEIQDGRFGFVHRSKILLSDYLKAFRGGALGHRLIPALDFFHPSLQLAQLSERDCQRYRDYISRLDGLKPTSRNLYLSYFRIAINEAERNGLIAISPTRNMAGIKSDSRPREYLTSEELNRFAAYEPTSEAMATNQRVFLFSCLTGLRWSDVCSLRWCDVQKDDLGYRLRKKIVKTRRTDYIALNDDALALLGERCDDDALVFPSLSRFLMYKHIAEICSGSGIRKHITFHCARHTFATLLVSSSVDIYVISKLLGHKSVDTTQIYAKIVGEKQREAVAALPRIKQKK